MNHDPARPMIPSLGLSQIHGADYLATAEREGMDPAERLAYFMEVAALHRAELERLAARTALSPAAAMRLRTAHRRTITELDALVFDGDVPGLDDRYVPAACERCGEECFTDEALCASCTLDEHEEAAR